MLGLGTRPSFDCSGTGKGLVDWPQRWSPGKQDAKTLPGRRCGIAASQVSDHAQGSLAERLYGNSQVFTKPLQGVSPGLRGLRLNVTPAGVVVEGVVDAGVYAKLKRRSGVG